MKFVDIGRDSKIPGEPGDFLGVAVDCSPFELSDGFRRSLFLLHRCCCHRCRCWCCCYTSPFIAARPLLFSAVQARVIPA